MSDKPADKKPEKKSFGQKLAGALLAVLFFVIFLMILDPLLQMAFGAGTSIVGGVASGMQGVSGALMRANVSVSLFTTAFIGLLLRILILALGIALSAKLGLAIAAWMKPHGAPAAH